LQGGVGDQHDGEPALPVLMGRVINYQCGYNHGQVLW
jgi:hypothetical protein